MSSTAATAAPVKRRKTSHTPTPSAPADKHEKAPKLHKKKKKSIAPKEPETVAESDNDEQKASSDEKDEVNEEVKAAVTPDEPAAAEEEVKKTFADLVCSSLCIWRVVSSLSVGYHRGTMRSL